MAPASPAIVADTLTCVFGSTIAVDGAQFEVDAGEVFGFLGPNGAGKSTTARMLTGVIRPSSGRALIGGFDVSRQPSLARRLIGVVPEEANVYADLSVWDNVMLMGELHGLPKRLRTERGRMLLGRFEMTSRIDQKGKTLSKGLRQRLMLCMALVSAPRVLFLDEPTSGLDVASTQMVREVIANMNREHGMTIFLTTHNMEEADQLCHRVAIINRGQLAAIDTPAALRGRVNSRRSVVVTFSGPAAKPVDVLPDPDMDVQMLVNGWRVFCPDPGPLAQHIAARTAELGARIESLNTLSPTLEEVFMSIIGGSRVHA